MSKPEQEIPWPDAPEGTTHFAHESADYQYCESWYRYENGEWYGVNTYNADRIGNRGLKAWHHYGKALKRPMEDLIERETVSQ